jgi:hypothetical protein
MAKRRHNSVLINDYLAQFTHAPTTSTPVTQSVVTITELPTTATPAHMEAALTLVPQIAAPVRTWQEHALDLATKRGLLGTGCGGETTLTESGNLEAVIVRVWSISDPDTQHVVLYRAETDMAECNCLAAVHDRPCSHAGEAIHYGRYVRGLFTPEARAEEQRMQARDRAHEQNTQCLGY